MYLAFMFRSGVLPSSEFLAIDISNITERCENFYRIYEALFGKSNCTYNLHMICGHFLEIRTHGPLTETSAFKFE